MRVIKRKRRAGLKNRHHPRNRYRQYRTEPILLMKAIRPHRTVFERDSPPRTGCSMMIRSDGITSQPRSPPLGFAHNNAISHP